MIGFGNLGRKRELGIVYKDDVPLVFIDPTSEDFFENVLGYVTESKDVQAFIEAIKEVKEEGVKPFWKPIYDPSLDGKKVVFKAGNIPAVRYSYNFWKQKAEEMSTTLGQKWSVGTEYQYYTFLVWLVNRLEKKGLTIKEALNAIVLNSEELGHYCNSKFAQNDFENTGKREVCGVYDLANTFKMLSCTNKPDVGFWMAGGFFKEYSCNNSLANLSYSHNVDFIYGSGVGWLVLS